MTNYYSAGRVLSRIPKCRASEALLLLDPPLSGPPSVSEMLQDGRISVVRPQGGSQFLSVEINAALPPGFERPVAELVTGVLRRLHRFQVEVDPSDKYELSSLFEGFEVEIDAVSHDTYLSWPEHVPACVYPLLQHVAERLDLEIPRRGIPWVLKGEMAFTASGYVTPPDVQYGGSVFLVSAEGFEIYDTVDILSSRNEGMLPRATQDAIARIFLEEYGESLQNLPGAEERALKNFVQSIVARAAKGQLEADTFPNHLAAQLHATRVAVVEEEIRRLEGLPGKVS